MCKLVIYYYFYIEKLVIYTPREFQIGNYLVSSIDVITVSENGCEIAVALPSNIMMVIMILRTTIKWNILSRRPRQVIPDKRVSGNKEWWEGKVITGKFILAKNFLSARLICALIQSHVQPTIFFSLDQQNLSLIAPKLDPYKITAET